MKKTGQNEKWKSFAERKERLEKQNKHKTDQLANETLEDRTARLEHLSSLQKKCLENETLLGLNT